MTNSTSRRTRGIKGKRIILREAAQHEYQDGEDVSHLKAILENQ